MFATTIAEAGASVEGEVAISAGVIAMLEKQRVLGGSPVSERGQRHKGLQRNTGKRNDSIQRLACIYARRVVCVIICLNPQTQKKKSQGVRALNKAHLRGPYAPSQHRA